MVSDILQEYAKLADWFITEHPNHECKTTVENDDKEHRVNFCFSFSKNGNVYAIATYVEHGHFKDVQLYGSIKNNILRTSKRAVLEKMKDLQ